MVLEEGGTIHKSLVFSCVNDEMTLKLAKPVKQGVCLLRVPTHCMPLLHHFTLSFDGKQILAEPVEEMGDSPTLVQKRILELLLALFNETDKVNAFAECSPFVAFREHPDILATLASSFSTRSPVFDLVGGDLNELKLKAFLHSRVHQEGADVRLLPLIDFADHHTYANGFNHYHDALGYTESIEIQSNHMSGQSACMVCYKYRDALSSFINYGFLDKSATFLQSVPLSVDLGEFILGVEAGYLNENQLGMDRINSALPNYNFLFDETPFYISTFNFPDNDTMRLHYVMLPTVENERYLKEAIVFLLTCFEKRFSSAQGTINNTKNIHKIISTIVAENLSYYEGLGGLLAVSNLDMKLPAVSMLAKLVKRQSKLLRAYPN